MSVHFTIYCETCDRYGPDIIHAGGGTTVKLSSWWPRFHIQPDSSPSPTDLIQRRWSEFLTEHEWHELKAIHE